MKAGECPTALAYTLGLEKKKEEKKFPVLTKQVSRLTFSLFSQDCRSLSLSVFFSESFSRRKDSLRDKSKVIVLDIPVDRNRKTFFFFLVRSN